MMSGVPVLGGQGERGVCHKIFELLERLGRSCVDRCGPEATR
jgi:hypothetical protein